MSILGMVAAAAKTAHLIYEYSSAVKHAPAEARELSEELLAVANVLGMLRAHLEQENSKGHAFDRTSVIFSAVDGCNRRLQDISSALSTVPARSKLSRFISRLKWPMNRQDTVDAITALHRYLQIFHFAVSIDGL